MKKVWETPELKVLNINMTMAGPGIKTPDGVQPDPTEMIHHS
jgi:hypothetical protein